MLLSTNDDEIDLGSSSSSSSSSSNSSSSVFSRPRKRARKKPTPSERRTLLLQRFSLLDDSPRFTLLPTYALGLAAGVLAGVQALQRDEADVAIMWDGGRHHARRSKASGFCYVNDCVLAILKLMAGPKIPFAMEEAESSRVGCQEVSPDPLPPGSKEDGRSLEEREEGAESPLSLEQAPTTTRRPRVLYLDFDVHHGDGVAEAFLSSSPSDATSNSGGSKTARCPQVVTLSLHHASPGFFPSNPLSTLTPPNTPHPHTLSLPLERGCSSSTIARVWNSCVEPVRRAWKPDWVVVCCGVDGMAGDGEKTGVWNLGCGDGWTTEGELAWVVRRICEWTEEEGSGVKGVMLLGGGQQSRLLSLSLSPIQPLSLTEPNFHPPPPPPPSPPFYPFLGFFPSKGGYNHPNAARAFATFTSIALDRRPPLDPRTPIPDEILLDGDGHDDYGPSFDLEVPIGESGAGAPPPPPSSLSSLFFPTRTHTPSLTPLDRIPTRPQHPSVPRRAQLGLCDARRADRGESAKRGGEEPTPLKGGVGIQVG